MSGSAVVASLAGRFIHAPDSMRVLRIRQRHKRQGVQEMRLGAARPVAPSALHALWGPQPARGDRVRPLLSQTGRIAVAQAARTAGPGGGRRCRGAACRSRLLRLLRVSARVTTGRAQRACGRTAGRTPGQAATCRSGDAAGESPSRGCAARQARSRRGRARAGRCAQGGRSESARCPKLRRGSRGAGLVQENGGASTDSTSGVHGGGRGSRFVRIEEYTGEGMTWPGSSS